MFLGRFSDFFGYELLWPRHRRRRRPPPHFTRIYKRSKGVGTAWSDTHAGLVTEQLALNVSVNYPHCNLPPSYLL